MATTRPTIKYRDASGAAIADFFDMLRKEPASKWVTTPGADLRALSVIKTKLLRADRDALQLVGRLPDAAIASQIALVERRLSRELPKIVPGLEVDTHE